MTVNFTIRPSETYIKKQITLGIITTLIGVFALFIGAGHIMGLGILFLVIASIQKKRDITKYMTKVYNIYLNRCYLLD
ncbi:hypothetical protein J1N10_15655 [Carboxylicivirga sp. A043]|uniref:hypothetical protein n=1 Tax=Carboxylicivirga litoralis TaxID=2816963 RepID=UPI0021CB0EAB|nr:hypothetical protein [Carboxylicivirga sp. A043]MCU4157412.1 hypothetical protein [Carboxylicivirga sp. A043]